MSTTAREEELNEYFNDSINNNKRNTKSIGTMNNEDDNRHRKIRTHANDDNGDTEFDITGNFGIVVRGTSEKAKKLIDYAKNELDMYVVYRTASSEKLWVIPDSEVIVEDEDDYAYGNR